MAGPGQTSSFSFSADDLFNPCSGHTDSYSATDHEVARENTSADGRSHLDLQGNVELKVDDPTFGEGNGHESTYSVLSAPPTQSTTETYTVSVPTQFPGPDNNEKAIV